MAKEDIGDFYEFHFSSLFYSSFLFTGHLLTIVCENVNWQNCFEFLVFERGLSLLFLSLNLYGIGMSLSRFFVLLHLDLGTLWLQNLYFPLLSNWLLNLELISSSQQPNDNGDSKNSVYSLWLLVEIDNLIIYFVVCIALMLFLPMCIYWDRDIVICLKEVLKDSMPTLLWNKSNYSIFVPWY